MKTNDNGIVRDMTAEEIKELEIVQKQIEAQDKVEANRQELKKAILAKLGLTLDEVAALLS